MYDLCHPGYYFISKLGCNDHIKISTAFYVYIELCEGKRLWDVKYKYNNELSLIFLEAKKSKHSPVEIYVPWPAMYNITLSEIKKIQTILQNPWITFVFRSEDSTSVYYRVTLGLTKPLSPENTKQLKEKDEKKTALENDIRKNTSNLYQLAKSLTEKLLDSGNHVSQLPEKDETDEFQAGSSK